MKLNDLPARAAPQCSCLGLAAGSPGQETAASFSERAASLWPPCGSVRSSGTERPSCWLAASGPAEKTHSDGLVLRRLHRSSKGSRFVLGRREAFCAEKTPTLLNTRYNDSGKGGFKNQPSTSARAPRTFGEGIWAVKMVDDSRVQLDSEVVRSRWLAQVPWNCKQLAENVLSLLSHCSTPGFLAYLRFGSVVGVGLEGLYNHLRIWDRSPIGANQTPSPLSHNLRLDGGRQAWSSPTLFRQRHFLSEKVLLENTCTPMLATIPIGKKRKKTPRGTGFRGKKNGPEPDRIQGPMVQVANRASDRSWPSMPRSRSCSRRVSKQVRRVMDAEMRRRGGGEDDGSLSKRHGVDVE